jgi:hypothetical protein
MDTKNNPIEYWIEEGEERFWIYYPTTPNKGILLYSDKDTSPIHEEYYFPLADRGSRKLTPLEVVTYKMLGFI